MIIGEQRVSENNYYDGSHQQTSQSTSTTPTAQYEVLKRKLSGENDVECKNMSEKNCNAKMQFIENIITESYHTFQSDQIHQDGDQSYINLTVLTPSMVHYDKDAITIHPPSNDHQQHFIINHHESHQQNDQILIPHHNSNKQLVTTTSTSGNIGRYYQQQQQQHQHVQPSGENFKF